MMGGQVDYAALPFVIEFLGIQNIDKLIVQLLAIRDHQGQR